MNTTIFLPDPMPAAAPAGPSARYGLPPGAFGSVKR